MNTWRKRRMVVAFCLVSLAAGLAGCLKRTERFSVQPDGRVDLAVTLMGDADDFNGRDPLLTAHAPGWSVSEERNTRDDGTVEVTRTGQRSVAPGAAIPDSYAPPGSENADVCLRFPTSLTVEKRADGTYYHFRRVYAGRAAATIEYHKERIFQGELKDLIEQDPDTLSPEQQRSLIVAFIELEKEKALEFARGAGDELADAIPQDARLAAEAAVRGVYDSISVDWAVDLMTAPDKGDRIGAEAERIVAEAKAAVRSALNKQGIPATLVERFAAVHDRQMRRYAVTEDLGDESWEVRVSLPGVIIGHNGDKLDGGEVVWEFEADAIRDRDCVLMVTSRVAAK